MAAEDYAATVKVPKYKKAIEEQGLKFIPLIFESFGGINEEGEQAIQIVARRVVQRSVDPASTVIPDVYRRISMVLQRHNSRMVLTRTPSF